MKRRSFFAALGALIINPFAVAKKVAAEPSLIIKPTYIPLYTTACCWNIDIESFLLLKEPERDKFERELQDGMSRNATRNGDA